MVFQMTWVSPTWIWWALVRTLGFELLPSFSCSSYQHVNYYYQHPSHFHHFHHFVTRGGSPSLLQPPLMVSYSPVACCFVCWGGWKTELEGNWEWKCQEWWVWWVWKEKEEKNPLPVCWLHMEPNLSATESHVVSMMMKENELMGCECSPWSSAGASWSWWE